jgi:hypothetical protein
MINLVGFDGPEAHSIIYWSINGQQHSKTVCFSAEEEENALSRFHTSGDFYNSYDLATVSNTNGQSINYRKAETEWMAWESY